MKAKYLLTMIDTVHGFNDTRKYRTLTECRKMAVKLAGQFPDCRLTITNIGGKMLTETYGKTY